MVLRTARIEGEIVSKPKARDRIIVARWWLWLLRNSCAAAATTAAHDLSAAALAHARKGRLDGRVHHVCSNQREGRLPISASGEVVVICQAYSTTHGSPAVPPKYPSASGTQGDDSCNADDVRICQWCRLVGRQLRVPNAREIRLGCAGEEQEPDHPPQVQESILAGIVLLHRVVSRIHSSSQRGPHGDIAFLTPLPSNKIYSTCASLVSTCGCLQIPSRYGESCRCHGEIYERIRPKVRFLLLVRCMCLKNDKDISMIRRPNVHV